MQKERILGLGTPVHESMNGQFDDMAHSSIEGDVMNAGGALMQSVPSCSEGERGGREG